MPSDYYANDEWFEITGSRGIILVNRATGKLRTGPVLSHFDGTRWNHHDDIESDWASGFRNATLNFISAMRGREEPLLTGIQAREILKIVLAIIRSSNERREVFIDEFEQEDPETYAATRREREVREAQGRRSVTIDELRERGRIL